MGVLLDDQEVLPKVGENGGQVAQATDVYHAYAPSV